MTNKKTILVITDGIGFNEDSANNAFFSAKKPTYEYLFKNAPYSLIKTSGLAVGLPQGQMGNSEVGHMTMGCGQVLYQNLVKISMALQNGELAKNEALNELLNKCERVHVVGLLSDGGVHSHIEHFIGVANIIKERGKQLFLHAITDGRDVSPTSGAGFVKTLEEFDKSAIASLSGRFYAMDRDNRWDRVEKAYRVLVEGENGSSKTPSEYMYSEYEQKITDEFITPTSFNGYNGAKDGDGVVFINFRNDRMKELVRAYAKEQFDGFERVKKEIHVVTMTEYDGSFSFPIMFKQDTPSITLPKVISQARLSQMHTAETEKYAHVTFFFNGGEEEPEENESRVLVPSPKVATYDEAPQMSAKAVCDGVLKAMNEGYDFIVVNFANGDMVGHTGDFDSAVKAVECVDEQLGRILECAKEQGYNFVLTSDHGNCEAMADSKGSPLTNHTTFDVWCFVLANGVSEVRDGGLSNIAPTILKLMGLEIPKQMCESLI